MSQKNPKMSSEENGTEQESDSKQNGKNDDVKNITKEHDTQNEVTNGKDNNTERQTRKSKRTRSRSTTPLIVKNGSEKVDDVNKETKIIEEDEELQSGEEKDTENALVDEDSEKVIEPNKTEIEETPETDETVSLNEEKIVADLNSTEENVDIEYMDPLVLQSDEPCSELEFEENSDRESGKYSPALSRCLTRRSQNRNIPTPKTPKSLFDDLEPEKETPSSTPDLEAPKTSLPKDFNDSDNSSNTDNLSTKVQIGGDTIGRLDFSESESDFLVSLKNRENNTSYPRSLSSRRSIRPASEEIRKKLMKSSMLQRANLSIPFFSRDSVERAPSVKRKSRSETPEDRKRFKGQDASDGILAKITSPFSGLRSKFAGSPNGTSTPKLTSYRDRTNHFGGDFFDQMENAPQEGVDEQGQQNNNYNKWCSIM